MKKNLMVLVMALSLATGWCGLAWGSSGANGPHSDYRTGYKPSACSGAACHSVTKGAFVPETLDNNAGTRENWNNFCLTCHNASGEAHEKTAGTPSNNTYINYTGLVPGDKGVSHSWKGLNKNAGTRTPTSSFFNRTAYMANATIVVCETCHKGPIKGAEDIKWLEATDDDYSNDTIHYKILGYASTPQYLSQYLKVYRSGSAMTTPLAQRRDWKPYLVSPSEYTYDNSNATITFSASQGGNYIYVELAEPYLRGSNAGNVLCLDCHNTRSDQNQWVTHEPGTGEKDNHPVAVNYGYGFGRQSTIKPSSNRNAYIEGGQVLCTSCHDPHNAASNDGMILREADGYTLCADCHKTKLDGYSTAGSVNIHNGSKHSSPTMCLDCHGTHDSRNIMLVKNVINGESINFQNFSGANSFGNDTGSGICETCHTATDYHKTDGSGGGHHTSDRCTKCHTHETGFLAGDCTSCHGMPPAPGNVIDASFGWSDTTGGKHAVHEGYIGLSGQALCATCHGSKPGSPHPEYLDTAYIDASGWTGAYGPASFGIGTTIGKVSTYDDTCTNVYCHSGAGTRQWGGSSQCGSIECHPYPGSGNEWSSGNGHAVKYDGVTNTHLTVSGYNYQTDTYAAVTSDPARCGKCHPASGVHMNSTINVSITPGYDKCAPPTFNPDKTCSNVKCHGTQNTPNWY